MDLCHNLKGRIIVYCLELEPDSEGRPYRYVGSTTSCERRCAEHMGVANGKGASWCASHKPIDIVSVRICNTQEEAAAMEVMLTSLHQATSGYQQVRGGEVEHEPGYEKEAPVF